jgi:hypothetical protein
MAGGDGGAAPPSTAAEDGRACAADPLSEPGVDAGAIDDFVGSVLARDH